MQTVTFTDAMWHLIQNAADVDDTTPEQVVIGAVLADAMTRVRRQSASTTEVAR